MQISKGDLVDTTFQTIGGQFGTLGTVDQSLADLADFEDGGGFDVVPVLSGERINDLLFDTLFAGFGEPLDEKRIEKLPMLLFSGKHFKELFCRFPHKLRHKKVKTLHKMVHLIFHKL